MDPFIGRRHPGVHWQRGSFGVGASKTYEIQLGRGPILRNLWRLPWWLFSPLTGSKSFVGNPILGSARLNRLGLHAARVRLAHALARGRRNRLAGNLPPELQAQFEANGFVIVEDFLAPAEFAEMRDHLLALDHPARSHQQGNTITTRVPVGPHLISQVPNLGQLLSSSKLKSILAYVASFRSSPFFYLQAIATGVAEGPEDPQQELHADTFHPSMKAWLFLNDVGEEDAPLTYVAGSHKPTPARIAWERKRSIDVLVNGDRLSQRGSLRISASDLDELALPLPTRFVVPANTLVVIDTCGFHARGRSRQKTLRTEIWAYCRRSPFLPWTGLDPLSWGPIAKRKSEWLAGALDWLDQRGWAKQHWKPDRTWRELTVAPITRPPAGVVQPMASRVPVTTADCRADEFTPQV